MLLLRAPWSLFPKQQCAEVGGSQDYAVSEHSIPGRMAFPVYVAHCTRQETCLIWSDGKEDGSSARPEKWAPRQLDTQLRPQVSLSFGAQLSEVSVIPRLALFLVMTWLEPSQGKCSHCAPEGRGRHSPHTEQTFSGPLLGCRMAVSQLLANCGECPDGFQAGARREVSFPPTTRAAYVDTQ